MSIQRYKKCMFNPAILLLSLVYFTIISYLDYWNSLLILLNSTLFSSNSIFHTATKMITSFTFWNLPTVSTACRIKFKGLAIVLKAFNSLIPPSPLWSYFLSFLTQATRGILASLMIPLPTLTSGSLQLSISPILNSFLPCTHMVLITSFGPLTNDLLK